MSASAHRDALDADAFRDLEGGIGRIRDAAALLEMAADGTVFQSEGTMAKELRESCNIKSHYLLLLTNDQIRALNYAIMHLNDLIRGLYRDYHRGEVG